MKPGARPKVLGKVQGEVAGSQQETVQEGAMPRVSGATAGAMLQVLGATSGAKHRGSGAEVGAKPQMSGAASGATPQGAWCQLRCRASGVRDSPESGFKASCQRKSVKVLGRS